MEKNSYLSLAENEYLYMNTDYERGIVIHDFNRTVVTCQQACEKYLKYILQIGFENNKQNSDLLHSHNLRAIYNKITTKYQFDVDKKDCKWVGDFYYDARYPGDDFVEVTQNDAIEAMAITEKIRAATLSLVQEINKEKEEEKENLAKIKQSEEFDFDDI